MVDQHRILGVGSPLVDCITYVEDSFLQFMPGPKGDSLALSESQLTQLLDYPHSSVFYRTGGSAANTILGLAQLGMSTSFLGKLGEDRWGEFYREAHEKAGVDPSSFKSTSQSHTGCCLCAITPDAERTFGFHLGAAGLLNAKDISVKDFTGFTHVHIEGYLFFNPPLIQKVLECAKEAGCSVSFDLGTRDVVLHNRSLLQELLSNYVDFVFANELEAEEFCETDNPKIAVKKLHEYCPNAVVKVGKDGVWIARDQTVVQVPSFSAEPVDTTGAGDFWAAGFLYGVYNGQSLEESARLGNYLGARTVEQVGAHLPKEEWDAAKRLETYQT